MLFIRIYLLNFFYNWIELSVSSYGKVEDYFKNDLNPIVTLHDPENDIKLIKVTFRDNFGNQVETISNHDRSMGNLLHFYLKKIGAQFWEATEKDIQFIYNHKNIKYDNNKTIRDYFNIDEINKKSDIIILVHILDGKYITFKDNHGNKKKFLINKEMSVHELIVRYFYNCNLSDTFGEIEIQFFYKKKKIDIKDTTKVKFLFQKDANPIIEVYDPLGLLIINPEFKYNVTFETSQGIKDNSYFSVFNTMSKLFNNYLDYMGVSLNDKNKIKFLYNGELIDEKRCVIKYFKEESNPKIFVMDPYCLLNNISGKSGSNKITVLFSTSKGNNFNITVDYGTTIDKLLKLYCWRDGLTECIGTRDNIAFTFNANQLKFGDQTPVEGYFKYTSLPKVVVIDQKNIVLCGI